MDGYYILNQDHTVRQADFFEWGTWFETADRVVKKTTYPDGVEVSTVFLGLNHNFSGQGFPVLFETMIFGGDNDQFCERYSTWEEAEKGHYDVIENVLHRAVPDSLEGVKTAWQNVLDAIQRQKGLGQNEVPSS